jgi:two-component system chemotaxis response regulator CheY
MSAKRVLSLGQCGADHMSIAGLLQRHFGAEVVPVDSLDDAIAELRRSEFDLVLINRRLEYHGTSGLDCIAALKMDDTLAAVPVMLVSNFRDAQRDAAALGALPGFGKAALGDTTTVARLAEVLGGTP